MRDSPAKHLDKGEGSSVQGAPCRLHRFWHLHSEGLRHSDFSRTWHWHATPDITTCLQQGWSQICLAILLFLLHSKWWSRTVPEVGKSTWWNCSLDVMIHPRNWSLSEELDQSMVTGWWTTPVMLWPRCSQTASLLSRAFAHRHPAVQLSSRLSAWLQERSLFLAPGRCSSVCRWMKQPRRSNSTQKRAVVLTDTQSRQ